MSKYFNVNNPSQIITIVSDRDSFYQLSDGNMIKKESFMSKYQPVLDNFETDHINEGVTPTYTNSDRIDASSFFNATSLSTNDINIIKSTDPSIVPNIPDGVDRSEINLNTTDKTKTRNTQHSSNESLVTKVDNQIIPNNTKTDVSQYKVYDNDDDAYEDFIKNSGITVNPTSQPKPKTQQPSYDPMIEINSLYDDELIGFGKEEADNRKNKRLSKLTNQQTYTQTEQTTENNTPKEMESGNQIPNYQPTIDPIKMMFSTFKRNHEITFDVQFKDKIANPEFIKMMMENMDGDIISYYKKMIMDNIMKNLYIIEGVVEKELKELLGEKEEIKPIKTQKPKKVVEPKRPEIRIIPETSVPKKPKTTK